MCSPADSWVSTNIGVFDRTQPLPTGGSLEQADGTGVDAFFCQNMLEMALILADNNPEEYEDYAFNFVQHFVWIVYSMNRIGEFPDEMWDEEDGFFYTYCECLMVLVGGLKIRSMVGLLPLCASIILEQDQIKLPRLSELIQLFRERYPEVLAQISPTEEGHVGHAGGGCCRHSRKIGLRGF
jgi:hypothetical protein